MNKQKIYITTLPYVNAEPHIGHALEFVQADALKIFLKQIRKRKCFNVGTDEHGQKIFNKAKRKDYLSTIL